MTGDPNNHVIPDPIGDPDNPVIPDPIGDPDNPVIPDPIGDPDKKQQTNKNNNIMDKTIIPATYESPKVEEMTLEIEGAILSFSNKPYEDDDPLQF